MIKTINYKIKNLHRELKIIKGDISDVYNKQIHFTIKKIQQPIQKLFGRV